MKHGITVEADVRTLPDCPPEAVLQRRRAHIQDMDLGVPGVDAGHLIKQEDQSVSRRTKTQSHYLSSKKQNPVSLHTLQVTMAPTSGNSCVSVSLTTEITGN